VEVARNRHTRYSSCHQRDHPAAITARRAAQLFRMRIAKDPNANCQRPRGDTPPKSVCARFSRVLLFSEGFALDLR
jgi:hypothetical protein